MILVHRSTRIPESSESTTKKVEANQVVEIAALITEIIALRMLVTVLKAILLTVTIMGRRMVGRETDLHRRLTDAPILMLSEGLIVSFRESLTPPQSKQHSGSRARTDLDALRFLQVPTPLFQRNMLALERMRCLRMLSLTHLILSTRLPS